MPIRTRTLSALALAAALLSACRTAPEKARVVTPPSQGTGQPAIAPQGAAPAPSAQPATPPPPPPSAAGPEPTEPPEGTEPPPQPPGQPEPQMPQPAQAPPPGLQAVPAPAAPAPAAPAAPPATGSATAPAAPNTPSTAGSAPAPAMPPATGSAPSPQPAPRAAPPTTTSELSTPPPPAHQVQPPRGTRTAPSAGAAPSAPGAPSSAAGASRSGDPEAPREVRQYTIEQLLASVTLAGASFSPDASKILVTGNQTGVRNAYAISISDGRATPITRSTDNNVEAEGYFPADERVLVSSDRGGNELTHLLVRELDGTLRDLTPGEKVKATFLGWAPDERSFFVSINERDPRFADVYEYAVDGYARKLLYRDDAGLDFGAVSPDRRYVALTRHLTSLDSDVLLYDVASGQTKNLTEHSGEPVASQPKAFTPDGSGLLYTTDQGSDFAYLVRYDLASGERSEVLRPAWDVTDAQFSRDGRHLVVSVNADARTQVQVFELVGRGMRPVRLPDLSRADVTSVAFSRDGTLMSFYADSSRSPRNLYVFSLASGTVRQLTRTLNPQVRAEDLVAGEVVRFRSYDGTEVPGLLYRPHGAGRESKAPAVVWVHGGPGDQSRLVYNALIQYLANHGYVVYAINNRGSSGYGKRFYAMDDRKHGEADLGDCVASKKMLAGLGYVDPQRIAIMGGSYGGYMVLAALAYQPREFVAGVDFYGVANWVRTLQSVPAWWEPIRQSLYTEMGDPAADAERLRRISPLFHADRIERPLMVIQGANDPRVLRAESDEIVEAARKKGVPVEYIVFPDEGHGITKRANQAHAYEAVLRFLDRYVKVSGPGPGTAAAPASPGRL